MTSVRESDVIAAARSVVAESFTAQEVTDDDYMAAVDRLRAVVAALDTPITHDEVLAAYREERAAIRAFMGNPQGDQEALLLAWDEARTRYMALLVEYAMGIGITVGKAERGLAAYLAAEVAAS